MRNPLPHHSMATLHTQRGIAAILVVILVGIGMTATAVSLIHSVRSTQEQQTAVHAATHAQTGVWAGVEAFRRYLATLDDAALGSLTGSFAIDFSGDVYGTLTAENITTTASGNVYRVNAQIINRHEAAQSASALGVIFEVGGDDCEGCVQLSAALDFYDDILVEGHIDFVMPEGTSPAMNVDGNVEILEVSVTKIGQLNATGSIKLDSGVEVEEIHSNGDVELLGSAQVEKVNTGGSVTTSGGAGARIIWANGLVDYGGSYDTHAINSLSNVDLSGADHAYVRTAGNVDVSDNAVNAVGDIYSQGNVSLIHTIPLGTTVAEGNFTCPNPGWTNFESISINGTLAMPVCNQAASQVDKVSENGSHSVSVMAPVQPFIMPPLIVDVWTLKSRANYVVEYDAGKGRTKVTVYNIAGQTDGTEYWLGDYPSGHHNSYLCTSFIESGEDAGQCATPTVPTLSMCLGHSLHNSCLSYNNGTWKFDGSSSAPGVFWFKGNLHLDNGYNYGTFLATGDVITGGQLRVESVNYAGYNEICLATGTGVQDHLRPDYNAMFSDQYPTNLCDISTGTYTPDMVGNIAIAAGGFDPESDGSFSGGNVTVGSSNKLYGTVLAGGVLKTGGQTEVYGHVTAAVQAGKGGDNNLLGGSTTVDLTRGSETYDPGKIPDMSNPDCVTGCEVEGDGERARLLWSKYL